MAYSSDMAATLRISQQVPSILDRQPSAKTNALPSSVREHPEEPETIEQLFFACLQTGDDKAAQRCLDRLTQHFGVSNERVMGLQGLYEEATAEGHTDLENCLNKYNGILEKNPVNVVCCVTHPWQSIIADSTFLLARYETSNSSPPFNVKAHRSDIRFDRICGSHSNGCRGLVRAGGFIPIPGDEFSSNILS